ncbi:hypothetical protein CIPAW_04G139400 [Carya illinoinensis]|uniref:Uncharacterized protein n=1 Tax=Carya illinoinensis TaxID=32201 RepID=A0A8T1QUD7_CARIL|nr:hypothetical protein CIPAW_04G139400 [Carya illinoinensis]
MVRILMGETPFTLTYGHEAMTSVEVGILASKGCDTSSFNKWVCPRAFKVGDLVLKQKGTTTRDKGKLGPQWEGPYVVTGNNHLGSYWLRDSQRNEPPHPWNTGRLWKFYC